ncbi:hypothetical protein [Thermococcus peptonophilus]
MLTWRTRRPPGSEVFKHFEVLLRGMKFGIYDDRHVEFVGQL